MFGPLGFKFRTPEANSTVFLHCYGGAIVGGVDADDGDAMAQRPRRGRQSESHLLAASCTVLLLFVLLQHVCAELALHHMRSFKCSGSGTVHVHSHSSE